MVKSPSSSLKKGQNAHYSYVKSSGYGKVSLPVKQSSNNDGLMSKELHTDVKWKSPTDRKQKGIDIINICQLSTALAMLYRLLIM